MTSIIDIAAALGPLSAKGRMFRAADEMLAFMDEYGIDGAVAYATRALADPAEGNRLMDAWAAGSGGRIQACHYVDAPDALMLEKSLKASRPACVRLLPKTQQYSLNPFYCGEVFEVLDALRIPVLLPEGEVDYEALPGFFSAFRYVPVVLLRQGVHHSRLLTPLLKAFDNLYLDTSNMVDAGLLDMYADKFGAHRLLFSSGMPQLEPCGALGLVLYANISQADKALILGGNWTELEGAIRWT